MRYDLMVAHGTIVEVVSSLIALLDGCQVSLGQHNGYRILIMGNVATMYGEMGSCLKIEGYQFRWNVQYEY